MKTRVYLHPVEPEKYPDYQRRCAKAITRQDLDNRIQFTVVRGFSTTATNLKAIGTAADEGVRPLQDDGSFLNNIEKTIASSQYFNLGKVIWPAYPTLFASNFEELVDLCVERGLYLYDFWGYVPGSRMVNDMWGEYSIPLETDRLLREKLGNRFLGYDNGEQDGRYISYTTATHPWIDNRKAQYKNFHAHFSKLGDAMQNHTVTLASLTFLHYFAREGNTIMLGAETAQALPSNPMWFSFIRGASKQYGLLNYGNASIWNRWGVKTYGNMSEEPDVSAGYEQGRTAGTSLSLLRRLIYNQYMYGCDILGFEAGWTIGRKAEEGETSSENTFVSGENAETLSPIGDIQRECARFVERYGKPGIAYTPVAIIADAFSGWVPPCHLYTNSIWRVWGNIPYGVGDYQLHCLFDMLFPGYERSGSFRDESGFLTPAPYGECADVLLSDVSGEILARYDTVILLSDVTRDKELTDKLSTFVDNGGHLVSFDSSPISENKNVTVIPGNGLEHTGEKGTYSEPNKVIPHPYRFTAATRDILDKELRRSELIHINNDMLQYTLCIKDNTHYTLYVANNTYAPETFDILTPDGMAIVSVNEEIITDRASEHDEFLPRAKYRPADVKPNKCDGKYSITSHDCRIFSVETTELDYCEIAEINPLPRHEKLYLSKGYGSESAKDYLLFHPTFTQHFKGLMIPAEYFERISDECAKTEGHEFNLQKVSVIVDFTKLLNHYPDLTIIGNYPNRTRKAVERLKAVLLKAKLYGCDGAIFAVHRNAENECLFDDAKKSLYEVMREMKAFCDEEGIPAYMNNRPVFTGFEEQLKMTLAEGMPELAFNTSYAACDGKDASLPDNTSLLMLSAPEHDVLGQLYPFCKPISGSTEEAELTEAYKAAEQKNIPVILAAEYQNWDEVITDIEILEK